jgi:hypothetical protein
MQSDKLLLLTSQQTLLLRAALLDGPTALDAWQAWKSNIDIDTLDPGSYCLLPLLYRNLQRHTIVDPLMDRFKGVYRKTWYQNQVLFHHMAGVLRALHAAGIPAMLLKGAALIQLHYTDAGLRPMADFDVLVPREQAMPAIEVLRAKVLLVGTFQPTPNHLNTRSELGHG